MKKIGVIESKSEEPQPTIILSVQVVQVQMPICNTISLRHLQIHLRRPLVEGVGGVRVGVTKRNQKIAPSCSVLMTEQSHNHRVAAIIFLQTSTLPIIRKICF